MTLRYIGHSCFVFESECGTRVVCDPFDGVGIPMPRLIADGVTVSHAHFDHNFISAVETDCVMTRAGDYTVHDVSISAIPSFHDEVQGKKRGSNLIFKFLIDKLTVTHLGDLGEDFSLSRIQEIGKTDILLIPVGGTYTITAKEARKYIQAINPSIVIPMHYKAQGITIDIAPLSEFIGLCAEEIEYRNGAVRFTCEDLPKCRKIIVMEREHE